MQETPTHEVAVHGPEDEFQEKRTVLFGSAVDLKRRSGWASGLSDAAAQWRMKRKRTVVVRGVGFRLGAAAAIVGLCCV